ncbi:hypothetical protein E4H12_04215 [Candidatus Thorarchaeota archaeon]|nr:MAG: hypothetical protein E4H12_04215 [Candidatus Thorarchaeota archaeon]
MNEDETFSGLAYDEYFTDRKCKELERAMRENPEFSEYRLKRQHWGEDWKLDPYFVQDEDEANLIFMEPEIVDGLSDSEFLSFVDTEMKYTESSESSVWHPIVLLGLLYFVTIINSIGVIIYFSSLDVIRAVGPMLVLDLITFILGTIYYRKRKRMISTRRHIDLIEARENPMFVSALQKLVSIPNLERSKEYRNRLQYIEATLEGVSS